MRPIKENLTNVRIFIIDDDLIHLNVFEQNLLNIGLHNIMTFRNMEDFKDKLYAQPEVVFVSTYSDKISPKQVYKNTKKTYPSAKVVFILSKATKQSISLKINHPNFEFIIKNKFQPEKIKTILENSQQPQKIKFKNFKNFLRFFFPPFK